MKGAELRTIREGLGLTRDEFARELGYTGSINTNKVTITRFENDRKQIPLYIARLAWLLGEIAADVEQNAMEMWPSAVGDDGKIAWPSWDGYAFEAEPIPGPAAKGRR